MAKGHPRCEGRCENCLLDIVMLRSLMTSAKLPEWDSRRESQIVTC